MQQTTKGSTYQICRLAALAWAAIHDHEKAPKRAGDEEDK